MAFSINSFNRYVVGYIVLFIFDYFGSQNAEASSDTEDELPETTGPRTNTLEEFKRMV